MKPFQSIYFVRHNLKKILTVMIMIALTGLLYVGGSYLSNIEVEFIKVIDRHNDFSFVNLTSCDADQKAAFWEEVGKDETIRMIPVGVNSFQFPTVLTFKNGESAYSYSVKDFLWVNERTGWVEDTTLIKDNTLFLTERYATYLGLKEGDLFTENQDELYFYYGEKPFLVQLMKGDVFAACLIAEDSAANEYYHMTWNDKKDAEGFGKKVAELQKKYEKIPITTYEDIYERVKDIFAINSVIFLGIIVVVTCVFFITINAVLVGIYEKRKAEFQIYESIGIPKAKIRRKVVGELLIMSAVGMVLGLLLAFMVITLLNVCIFAKDGLQLYYHHPWAIGSWLICNMMILLPSMLLRLRGIMKSSGEV